MKEMSLKIMLFEKVKLSNFICVDDEGTNVKSRIYKDYVCHQNDTFSTSPMFCVPNPPTNMNGSHTLGFKFSKTENSNKYTSTIENENKSHKFTGLSVHTEIYDLFLSKTPVFTNVFQATSKFLRPTLHQNLIFCDVYISSVEYLKNKNAQHHCLSVDFGRWGHQILKYKPQLISESQTERIEVLDEFFYCNSVHNLWEVIAFLFDKFAGQFTLLPKNLNITPEKICLSKSFKINCAFFAQYVRVFCGLSFHKSPTKNAIRKKSRWFESLLQIIKPLNPTGAPVKTCAKAQPFMCQMDNFQCVNNNVGRIEQDSNEKEGNNECGCIETIF